MLNHNILIKKHIDSDTTYGYIRKLLDDGLFKYDLDAEEETETEIVKDMIKKFIQQLSIDIVSLLNKYNECR